MGRADFNHLVQFKRRDLELGQGSRRKASNLFRGAFPSPSSKNKFPADQRLHQYVFSSIGRAATVVLFIAAGTAIAGAGMEAINLDLASANSWSLSFPSSCKSASFVGVLLKRRVAAANTRATEQRVRSGKRNGRQFCSDSDFKASGSLSSRLNRASSCVSRFCVSASSGSP